MAPRSRRALFSATVFLATCGILGSVISQKVAAQSASDESSLRDSLKAFTSVYSVVEQNYAEKMNSDRTDKAIYDGAIPGMLHTLDPHSNFYDPKAYAQMREDQHGRYYGVGMTIQPQLVDGTLKVFVLYPFEGTPSYKAGIRPGDQIISVDGKLTDGMDSTAVATMLKGPRGTHVLVTMTREGKDKPLSFDLVRDEIPRPSVDIAFLIQPNVGYMHVTNFQETTAHEVGETLDKFPRAGTNSRAGDRPAGESGRAVEPGCGYGGQVPAKGTGRRLAAWTDRAGPGVFGFARRDWAKVSDRGACESRHGFRSGDCLRGAAGP